MLCWAWNVLGKPEKTEAIIKRQIEKYPVLQTGYTNMGFLYMSQEKFEEAIEYYEKALVAPITNERKRLYCYEQLATAYGEIGDKTKSLDCYRKALDLYNSYWIPKQSRGKVDGIEEVLNKED